MRLKALCQCHLDELECYSVRALGGGIGLAFPLALAGGWGGRISFNFYLVDPASSHMLVTKTKPCMCKITAFVSPVRGWLIKSAIISQPTVFLIG